MATALFKNEATGEVREVKIGVSWTLFFFGWLFGLPLFMRKLNYYGLVMLIIQLGVCIFAVMETTSILYSDEAKAARILAQIAQFIICAYLHYRGNKMTALNYIALGFKVAETDKTRIEIIKRAWWLPDSAFIANENQTLNSDKN